MDISARKAIPNLVLIALVYWNPTAADTQVSAECGIAAAGSIEVGGSVWIECGTPAKLLNLITEQQAFRKSQLARIKDVAAHLGINDCAAEELLAEVARQALPAGENAVRLAKLAAELRGTQADQDSVHADGLVSEGSIEVSRHVVVGLHPQELEDLMQQMRNVDARYLTRIDNLGKALQFSRCATSKFLQILDRKDVPPEKLSETLTKIANEHRKTVAELSALTTPDPQLVELKRLAMKAVDNGDYETAKRHLALAREILDEKSKETAPVAQDKASIAAIEARTELTELRYEEAANLFEEAADHSREAGKPMGRARNLELAGAAFQDAGLYRDALSSYRKALTIRKEKPDESPTGAVITTLNNMGGLRFSASDYRNAKKRFDEALIEIDQSSARIDVDLRATLEAVSHSGLADVSVAISEYDTAEEHYAQALSLMEFLHGTDDRLLLPTITNWGWLKMNRGEYRCAESLFVRAKTISKSGGKAPTLDAAATENNLAALYFKTGRYEQAEKTWKQVAEIYEQKLGATHPATLVVTQNRARALRKKGKLGEAEEVYDLALSNWETIALDEGQVQGSHLVIASLHAGLGDLYFDQNRLTEARAQYEDAIGKAKTMLRDSDVAANSLVIAGYKHDLAIVCEELGDYSEALEHLEKAVNTMETKLPANHPDLGTASNSLGRVLMHLGRPGDAVRHYLTAVAAAERSQQPLKAAARRRRLAFAYKELQEIDEARSHLEAAQELYANLGPEEAEDLARLLDEVGHELSELNGEPKR